MHRSALSCPMGEESRTKRTCWERVHFGGRTCRILQDVNKYDHRWRGHESYESWQLWDAKQIFCRSFADRRLISDRAVAMAAILGAWGSHGVAAVAVVEGRVDSAALRHQPGPRCHVPCHGPCHVAWPSPCLEVVKESGRRSRFGDFGDDFQCRV